MKSYIAPVNFSAFKLSEYNLKFNLGPIYTRWELFD